jgi:MOSC domain-containing protein YiiM
VTGRIEAIYIADPELPVRLVERATVEAGKGIVGDHKYFPDGAAPGRALTLVAMEALEAAAEDDGIDLRDGLSRRQVHTRGVDVNALVGKRFRIGALECVGVELCEPCLHLESLTQPGVIKSLVHRAGLNADVLTGGDIAVGDSVTAED